MVMMKDLLLEINKCRHCAAHLPFEPRPVVQASTQSKILIVGQAPGLKVQESGIPWNDKSGDNLRRWLGLDKAVFYNPELFSLVPMGFCYPGTGKQGDVPPRPECAPLWHAKLVNQMPHLQLVSLVGHYAQNFYLGKNTQNNLTETVRHFDKYLPHFFPLPHPSPRNNIWQAKNKWFVQKVLPALKEQITALL